MAGRRQNGVEWHRRCFAEAAEIGRQPQVHRLMAEVLQLLDQIAVGTELGRSRIGAEVGVAADPMQEHLAIAAALQFAAPDALVDEFDVAQFAHQRRVERDLVQPVEDAGRRSWHLLAPDRVDLHQQHVG